MPDRHEHPPSLLEMAPAPGTRGLGLSPVRASSGSRCWPTPPPTALTAEVMGTGTLEARVKTTLSPRIQERLAEVLVDQGDAITNGQLLARLDDGEQRQQVAVAEATVVAARATVERVRADQARPKPCFARPDSIISGWKSWWRPKSPHRPTSTKRPRL